MYHRTSTNHQVAGACFRYSEIGWFKDAYLDGLIVWDSGCNRQERYFTLTAGTHLYSEQYYSSGGSDRYAWYVDGRGIASGVTNFSYSTTVTEGGEVAVGVESMGNTLAYENRKLVRQADGSYTFLLWGGHWDYVDDPPYTNTDGPDPNNDFRSVGN